MRKRYIKHYKFNLKGIKKIDIVIMTIILIILSTIILIKKIGQEITPVLMEYAESKATNTATLMITQAVNDKVFSVMDIEDIFVTQKDNEGKITNVDFNPITVNKLLNMITNYVQEYIEKVESGDIDSLGVSDTIFSNYDMKKLKQGIIYEIPSGVVFNNSLLSNLGPKIPVKMSLVSDVISDLKTNVTNYGINNALIEVIVHVEVKIQVVLPFASKTVKAETNIPIALKMIQGSVPNLYYPTGTN